MDKRHIFLLAGLLAAVPVLAQEAYRWVDEDGVVHYSDRPDPKAEQIQLPEANTTTVRQYSRGEAQPPADEEGVAEPEEPFRYQSLSVATPGSDEHLWNIEGVLNVSLSLSPGLRPGHQVRVYFDGKAQMVSGTSFQLQDVYRGEHNLQAEILDETGKLMIRSRPSRFWVHQNTVGIRGGS